MATLDIDRFIIEIEDRPAIWDTWCNDYSNKISKGKAWLDAVIWCIHSALVYHDDDGGTARAEIMRLLPPQNPCWNCGFDGHGASHSGVTSYTRATLWCGSVKTQWLKHATLKRHSVANTKWLVYSRPKDQRKK